MHQNSKIFCDQDAKHLVYRNGRYTAEVDYGGGFRISSLAVRKKQLLDRNRGIHLFFEAEDGSLYSSLSGTMNTCALIRGSKVRLTAADDTVRYTIDLSFSADAIQLRCRRTFLKDVTVVSQGFPSFNFEENAAEHIRWDRSGANFWVGAKAADLRNSLSIGKNYKTLPEDWDESTRPSGNLSRAMEDLSFVFLSDAQSRIACSFTELGAHTFGRPGQPMPRSAAAVTARYESPEKENSEKPLMINICITDQKQPLEYATGSADGWPGKHCYTGRLRPQGRRHFKPITYERGHTDEATYRIAPREYADYYEIGSLRGVDGAAVTHVVNDFARMMIMDWNLGAVTENPNCFFELPPIEQHWIVNIFSTLCDIAPLRTIKNSLYIIRDKLQAADGHLTSPFPQSPQKDGWGHHYGDMGPGYVIALCTLYSLTGDAKMAFDLRQSAEGAVAYEAHTFLDKTRYVCTDMDPENHEIRKHSDYWEHTKGGCNGYVTVMYYEALKRLAQLELHLYQDPEKAQAYETLAEKIRVGFYKTFWSEQSRSFLYSTETPDTCYLPVQAAALRAGIAPDRACEKALVQTVERENAVFHLGFHAMNIRNIYDREDPCRYLHSNLGMDGGWYGCADGDFYAGFPVYGDRTLIPRYIHHFTEYFKQTGFLNATAYKRDGVTPSDNYFSCFPTHAGPIWGLFTYGYGFQPEAHRLLIAPFLHPCMNGSVVKYLWRGLLLTVRYDTPYRFTVTFAPGRRISEEIRPAPIFLSFINQTPGHVYHVRRGERLLDIPADSEGAVLVCLTEDQTAGGLPEMGEGEVTAVAAELLNPDPERIYADQRAAYQKPVAASSSLQQEISTEHWPLLLTDGSYTSGYWSPEPYDEKPYLRIDMGVCTIIGGLRLYVADADCYYYVIEGSEDPALACWDILADRSKEGVTADFRNPIQETFASMEENGTGYHYYRITFCGTRTQKPVRITEIEIGGSTVRTGLPEGYPAYFYVEKQTDRNRNLAKHKPVTTNSEIRGSENWAVDKLTDNSRNTNIESAGYSSEAFSNAACTVWVMIDLQEICEIGRVVLAPRSDNGFRGAFFPVDYSIDVSEDGTVWKTVYEAVGTKQPEQPVEVCFPAVSGRFVRLTATRLRNSSAGEHRLQLAEMEVYGPAEE